LLYEGVFPNTRFSLTYCFVDMLLSKYRNFLGHISQVPSFCGIFEYPEDESEVSQSGIHRNDIWLFYWGFLKKWLGLKSYKCKILCFVDCHYLLITRLSIWAAAYSLIKKKIVRELRTYKNQICFELHSTVLDSNFDNLLNETHPSKSNGELFRSCLDVT
jgi:hypothetical protein